MLLTLVVAIAAGGAPWRVCAAAHEAHAPLYLVGSSELLVHAHRHEDGRVDEHPGCPHGHERGPGHEPNEPQAPAPGHCHCDDQPLVTGMSFSAVGLDAPTPNAGPAPATLLVGRPTALPTAHVPADHGRVRVAHEEDAIVLLR